MSVINTNTQPLSAARNLDATQEILGRALARMSSGSKIVNPSDDAAGLAVSEKLISQNRRLKAAETNVQNATSRVQTADGFMANMTNVLSRMSELSVLAKDVTKNPADVALYQEEFSALQDQLRDTIGGATAVIGGTSDVSSPLGSFGGLALFGSGPGLNLSIGQAVDQQMTIPANNLQRGATLGLITKDSAGEYTLDLTSPDTFAKISGAIEQMVAERASLGGSQSRLNVAASTLQVEYENREAAVSRIRDSDVALESTQLAKYNILVESSTAMLAQANQTPTSVLRLLQQ